MWLIQDKTNEAVGQDYYWTESSNSQIIYRDSWLINYL